MRLWVLLNNVGMVYVFVGFLKMFEGMGTLIENVSLFFGVMVFDVKRLMRLFFELEVVFLLANLQSGIFDLFPQTIAW